jgi:hypothetical protein
LPRPAHSPNLAPGDYHLFSPLKDALGGKRFRANDEVRFEQRRVKDQSQIVFENGIKKVSERWRRCKEVLGEYAGNRYYLKNCLKFL